MKVTKAKALSTRHSCVATRVRPILAMPQRTAEPSAAISSPHASLRIGWDRAGNPHAERGFKSAWACFMAAAIKAGFCRSKSRFTA
jgi:hypothetical protein